VVAACEQHGVDADFYVKTLHHHEYPSAKLNYDSMWCGPGRDGRVDAGGPETVDRLQGHGRRGHPSAECVPLRVSHGVDFLLAGMFDYEIAEDVRITKSVLADLPPRPRPWYG
jgi:hypothetical protein